MASDFGSFGLVSKLEKLGSLLEAIKKVGGLSK